MFHPHWNFQELHVAIYFQTWNRGCDLNAQNRGIFSKTIYSCYERIWDYSAYRSNHLRAPYISLSNSYNNLKTSQLRDTKVRSWLWLQSTTPNSSVHHWIKWSVSGIVLMEKINACYQVCKWVNMESHWATQNQIL